MNHRILPLSDARTDELLAVVREGEPFVRARGVSDYWAYSTFFADTCFVARSGRPAVGVIIAFRSQADPDQVYIQDVVVRAAFRGRGVASKLVSAVEAAATRMGCRRLWLTSDPASPAVALWPKLGFLNRPGDAQVGSVWVTRNLKGPGLHRAVFEKTL